MDLDLVVPAGKLGYSDLEGDVSATSHRDC